MDCYYYMGNGRESKVTKILIDYIYKWMCIIDNIDFTRQSFFAMLYTHAG